MPALKTWECVRLNKPGPINLLDQLLMKLQKLPLEDVNIRHLYGSAKISEPAFYNYFPRKDDLLPFFIRLWSLEQALYLRDNKPGIKSITAMFQHAAQSACSAPVLYKEVMAYQMRTNTAVRVNLVTAPTPAEKQLHFGRIDGLDNIPDYGLGPILVSQIAIAIKYKEISEKADQDAVAAVFFGMPAILNPEQFSKLNQMYQNSVKLIFKSIGKNKSDGSNGKR